MARIGSALAIPALVLGLVLLTLFASAAGAPALAGQSGPDEPIVVKAQQAKDRFRARMRPPAPFLTLLQIVEREETRPARDFALLSFEAAIDALVAEAMRSTQAADAVEAALRKFVVTGKSAAADAIFAQIAERERQRGSGGARAEAEALRHGVALAEMPAALAPMIKLPGEALPFAPLGDKALPAYRLAAARDPQQPWTWLGIAWMQDAAGAAPTGIAQALDNADAAARASGDTAAALAVLETRGRQRAAEGRPAEAERALLAAVWLSEAGAADEPPAQREPAQAELARRLSLLGAFYARKGDAPAAADAFGRALAIRAQRAAVAGDDAAAQLDLSAAHLRLALLAEQTGDQSEAARHWNAAHRLYHIVAWRDRFLPTLDAAQSGAALQVFVLAGLLTLLGGLLLLARYRKAVARWMNAAARDRPVAEPATTAANASPATGERPAVDAFAILPPTEVRAHGRSVFEKGAGGGAAQALRRAALLQVLAGCAFAGVATALMFRLGDIDPSPLRAALLFWSWGWAAVLVQLLLWGRDRTMIAIVLGVYLGGLLLICSIVAAGDTPPLRLYGLTVPPFFQPLIFWAHNVAYSLFLLFFLNRRVRSVGPVLLVFMLIASIGGLLAQVAMSTYAATRAFAFLGAGIGLPAQLVLPLVALLGMIATALPAWWVIGRIRRAYENKRLSDQTLVFDAIWLFQALILCLELIFEAGLWGWLGLAAFVAYKLVAVVGQSLLAAAAARRPAARLLLLRVFGFRRRTERLFDLLGERWRHAGPIAMIGAPDLAARTIDPGEVMDFLGGRLRQRFIIEPGDLQTRLRQIDLHCDADGRYRVNDIFCGNDTWQAAVSRLMADSDLVVMDLRGFAPQNRGCAFELQALLDSVPTARFVLLVDASTDVAFLRRTLADCARSMAPASPNRGNPEPPRVLDVGTDDRGAVNALLRMADAVPARAA